MVQTMLRHTIHMFNIGLIESYVENYLRFTNTQTRYSINHKSLHLLSTMFVKLNDITWIDQAFYLHYHFQRYLDWHWHKISNLDINWKWYSFIKERSQNKLNFSFKILTDRTIVKRIWSKDYQIKPDIWEVIQQCSCNFSIIITIIVVF